jgi:uncharacterized RDD family membrane protein YckC
MTATTDGHTGRHNRRLREIVTPEGVALSIELAQLGERAAAFLIDLLLLVTAILIPALILVLLVMLTGMPFSGGLLMALFLLMSFAVRSFYFIYFELRWHGTTPGKRALKIRVIDRAGGHLRPDAFFARNLMREVKFFIPLSLLIVVGRMDHDTLVTLLGIAWTILLALMPLFNRDRMRTGDIVGGTWVVTAPKGALLPDMAGAKDTKDNKRRKDTAAADLAFTKTQLDACGIYELQTLETVLRQDGISGVAMREAVRDRIQKKIGWTPAANVEAANDKAANDKAANDKNDARAFLEAFYAALWGHL